MSPASFVASSPHRSVLRFPATSSSPLVAIVAVALMLPGLAKAQEFGGLPEEPLPPIPDGAAAAPAPVAPAAPPQNQLVEAPKAGNADEKFDLEAKAIEERVNDLKEKIFRTKERLKRLAEVVLEKEGIFRSGAKLRIAHRNELGSAYVLLGATYTLDGAVLFTKESEEGSLNEAEEIPIWDNRIVPGPHQLNVQFLIRGHGYGVLAYLEGIRIKVNHQFQFDVEPGKVTTVKATIFEQDGISLDFKDRPSVKFSQAAEREQAKTPAPEAAAPDAAAPAAPAATPAAAAPGAGGGDR